MSYKTLKTIEYMKNGSSEAEYQKRLSSENIYHIDIDVSGYPAFFIETKEIRDLAMRIHKYDKQLIKLCNELPENAIEQFSMRCLIDEIQLTNDIEGVRSTRREIGHAISSGANSRFKGIVNKYLMLLSKKNIKFNSCEDLRQIYDDLVLDEVVAASEDNRPDGILFRKNTVNVSSRLQKTIHTGLYPESKIIDAVTRAMAYVNNESVELLYRISVFHYLIGYIHPFYDGNGRLDRFISSYLLTREFEPVFSYRISYTIKDNKSKYDKAFDECNDPKNRGELTYFIEVFLSILLESMENLIEALEKRNNKWNYYKEMIDMLPRSEEQKYYFMYSELLRYELFSDKGVSIAALAGYVSVSIPTARKMLDVIKGFGILKVDTESTKSYLYGLDLDEIDKILA